MDWSDRYRRHFRRELRLRGVAPWAEGAVPAPADAGARDRTPPSEDPPRQDPAAAPGIEAATLERQEDSPSPRLDVAAKLDAASRLARQMGPPPGLAEDLRQRLTGQLPKALADQLVARLPALLPKLLEETLAERIAESKRAAADHAAHEQQERRKAEPLSDEERFIKENTEVSALQLTPEIKLHLATEITPLWEATEDFLQERGLQPPFWAFAWAGGQGLARFLLDYPDVVRGRRVLDFAAGGGLAAIAAAKSGAERAIATEIDPLAVTAIALNAEINQADVEPWMEDVIGRPNQGWDVILVGDMCYEQPLAERVVAWLREEAARGVPVLLGDPGRKYLPQDGLTEIARHKVPTSLELEDKLQQTAVVYQVNAV